MALGADNSRILQMVLRQGAVQLVVGLALGIGLTCLIAFIFDAGIRRQLNFNTDPTDVKTYALVAGVLLHAFTFRDSERLVDVQIVDPTNFSPSNFNSRITTMDFAEMKGRLTSFENFIGYLNGSTVNLTYNGQPKRLQGGYIT